MSDKVIDLTSQAALTEDQIAIIEEVRDHLIKVQSIIDVVSNSIEGKNKDNVLDLASELNTLVSGYDQLEHAIEDTESSLDAAKETELVDNKNA